MRFLVILASCSYERRYKQFSHLLSTLLRRSQDLSLRDLALGSSHRVTLQVGLDVLVLHILLFSESISGNHNIAGSEMVEGHLIVEVNLLLQTSSEEQ